MINNTKYLDNFLVSNRTPQPVKDDINNLKHENEELRHLTRVLMNRCEVFSRGLLCIHCDCRDMCKGEK